MKARLKDVAEKAGVAVNTASMILNRRPNSWASKETQSRVFKAAEDLDYRPNRGAVALRLGKFHTVALVIPDLINPYFALYAEALEAEMEKAGYDLILETSHSDVEREKACLESVIERQVDGIVCCLLDNEESRGWMEDRFKSGKAVVAMAESIAAALPVDCVTMNFTRGMTDAVRHLTDLGHRRIAFMSATAKGQDVGDRPLVFRKMMTEAGASSDGAIFAKCDHTMAGARAAARRLLSGDPAGRPTAVVAHNDLAAIGVMRAATDLRMRLPSELSVVGVDNTPIGEHLTVALTTVEQPTAIMVREAAQLLIRRMEKPDYAGPQRMEFPTRLIVRESTAPPLD